MLNEMVAISIGLTAGAFFFLAATFPALTIPLLAVTITGGTTLIVFSLIKLINKIQSTSKVVEELQKDVSKQIDEKYKDAKKITKKIAKDFKNTTQATINAASTDLQKIATKNLNTVREESMAAVQQKLNQLELVSRKKIGCYMHKLCITDAELIEPQKEEFQIKTNPSTLALAAKSSAMLGITTVCLGVICGADFSSILSGSGVAATAGASIGGMYGGVTNHYAPKSKAFLRKIDENNLECIFLNDQDEIQTEIFDIQCPPNTNLTEAFLDTHENLILEHINVSIIKRNLALSRGYVNKINEPTPKSLFAELENGPLIFSNQKILEPKKKRKTKKNKCTAH